MQVPLDPVTEEKLRAFARHRRRLVMRRGIAATLCVALAGTTVAALVDWQVVLPDTARLLLTFGVYALTAGVAWRLWLRPLVRLPSVKELARYIERAEPALRENLVSAVELALEAPDATYDSAVFRQLLQRFVAARLRGVAVEAMLPARVIRHWFVASGVACLVFCLLCVIPDVRFAQLVRRVLVPLANVARVSRTTCTILSPNPPDTVVPQGDPVTILVELSGPEAEKVLLETVKAGQGRRRIPMERAGGLRRYQAVLHTDEYAIRYRIRANDALTAYHTIETRLRPYARAFDLTYRFPLYTGWPEKRLSDLKRADVTALVGTDVTLVVHADQAIAQGTLEVEQGGEISSLPLQKLEEQRLRGSFRLKAEGEFKVNLVAAETGFDNAAVSPRYEIKAQEDQRPLITLKEPAGELLLAPDEILSSRGAARDDVGLQAIARLSRIDDGPWEEGVLLSGRALHAEPHTPVSFEDRWDLFPYKLSVGDTVTVKYRAVDLKGTRGETQPLTILVGTPAFRETDWSAVAAARQVLKELAGFSEKLRQLSDAAEQDPALVDRAFEAARASGRKVREAVDQALCYALPGPDSEELVSAGHRVDWCCEQRLPQAEAQLLENPQKARGVVKEVALVGKALREAFAACVDGDETEALLECLLSCTVEQEQLDAELTSEPDRELRRRRWQRRQRVSLKQLEALRRRAEDFGERAGPQARRAVSSLVERIAQVHRKLTAALQAEGKVAYPRHVQLQVQRLLQDCRRRWTSFAAEKARGASVKRRVLCGGAGAVSRSVEALAAFVRKRTEAFRKGPRAGTPSHHASELSQTSALFDRMLSFLRQWQSREETRPDTDLRYAADLDLLKRALQALRVKDTPQGGMETAKALSSASRAFAVLQLGHEVETLWSLLEQLRVVERQKPQPPQAVTEGPERWEFACVLLSVLPEGMSRLGIPKDIVRRLGAVRGTPAYRELSRRFEERLRKAQVGRSAGDRLTALSGEIAAVKEALAERLEEARRVLAQLAPSLSDMMRALAEKTEKVKEKTEALQTASGEQRSSELAEVYSEQTAVGAQVGDLAGALRHDALTGDLLTEEGRERFQDSRIAEAMIEEPASRAQRALQEAITTPGEENQAEHLREAAQAQGDLAGALRELADHYGRLQRGESVEQTRAALRQHEAAQAAALQSAPLQQLAALSELSPQQLLKALEEELGRNRPMQRELSDIARNAVEEARGLLQHAAQKEDSVLEALGESEAAQAQREAKLRSRLAKLARSTERLAKGPVSQLQESLSKLTGGAEPALKQALQGLSEARRAAAAPAPSSLRVAAQAQQARAALNRAYQALNQAARRAEEVFHKAQREAKGALSQEGQQGGRAERLARARERAAGQATAKAASAALGAGQLSSEAERLAREAERTGGALARGAEAQDAVGHTLLEAAGTLGRAARHEERLGRAGTGEELQRISEGVRGIAAREVPEARQALTGGSPAEARRAVGRAKHAISEQIEALDALGERPGTGELAMAGPGPQGEEGQSQSRGTGQGSGQSSEGGGQSSEGGGGQPSEGAGQSSEGAPAAGQEAQGGGQSAQAAGGRGRTAGSGGSESAAPGGQAQTAASGMVSPGAFSEEAGAMLAHALDALDRALFGALSAGGGPGQGPSGQGAGQFLAQAARAQAQALSGASAGGGQASGPAAAPSSLPFSEGFVGTSAGGAAVESPGIHTGGLSSTAPARRSYLWGKLPPKLAKDLATGSRARVPEQYRSMVEAYFKALAKKAQESAK